MTGLRVPTPLLYAIYTLFSVVGMVLVKYAFPLLRAAGRDGPYAGPLGLLTVGAALYVVGFATWMVILARSPLTVAYPTAVGLTMAFSTLCAAVFLKESLSLGTTIGGLLVFIGIVLLARG